MNNNKNDNQLDNVKLKKKKKRIKIYCVCLNIFHMIKLISKFCCFVCIKKKKCQFFLRLIK